MSGSSDQPPSLSLATNSYLAPTSLAQARANVEQRLSSFDRAEITRLGSGPPKAELVKIETTGARCVVADFVLWQPAWDAAHLAALSELLRPAGCVIFVEPVATYGWRRGLHRGAQSRYRNALGYDFEKDVPADLRQAGLILTTVDRFDLNRTHSYAWGQAQHFAAD